MIELTKLGIDLKGRTSGEFKTTCPKCSSGRKKQNDACLSVNITTGIYHCFNCEWKGNAMKREREEKTYTLPIKNLTKLSENTLKWFKGRGIGQSTIMKFELTEGLEWMPQEGKEMNTIQFNYFEGETLVNVKYRDAKKNFKQFKGGKPVFYNLNCMQAFDEIIIVEGEIDALSFYEAGYPNVISVPAGATDSESATLEYLNICYDYLNSKKFIIAVDNDPKGIAFRNVLANRLGKDICRYIAFEEGVKDANDLLVMYGSEDFRNHLDIHDFPLDGVEKLSDFEYDLDNIYLNGYPEGQRLGYPSFDKLITWFPSQVTVLTGIPGHGKSEFVDQIIIKLAEFNWKSGIFSAENQPAAQHAVKLIEKKVEKSMFGFDKMTDTQYQLAKGFLNEMFFFIKFNEVNLSIDSILQRGKELVTRHGIKMLVIDNWANLDHQYEGMSEHQYIGQSLIKIMNFSKMYNIHIIVVAHPTKIYKNKDTGLHEVPNLYSISGSSHWFNKPDNGITIYRDMETGQTEVHVQKVRWKFTGKVGHSVFNYKKGAGTYLDIYSPSSKQGKDDDQPPF